MARPPDHADLLPREEVNDDRVVRLMEIFPSLSWRQLRSYCNLFPADVEFDFLVESLIDVQPDGGTPPQETQGQDDVMLPEQPGRDEGAAAIEPAEKEAAIEPAEKEAAIGPAGIEAEGGVEIVWPPRRLAGSPLPSRPRFGTGRRSFRSPRRNQREDRVPKPGLKPYLGWTVASDTGTVLELQLPERSPLANPGPATSGLKIHLTDAASDEDSRKSEETSGDSDTSSEFKDATGDSENSQEGTQKPAKDSDVASESSEEESEDSDEIYDDFIRAVQRGEVDAEGSESDEDYDVDVDPEETESEYDDVDVDPEETSEEDEVDVEAEEDDATYVEAVVMRPPEDAPLVLRLAEMFPDTPMEALTKFFEENPGLSLEQLVQEFLLRQEAQEAAGLFEAVVESVVSDDVVTEADVIDDVAVSEALAEDEIETLEEPADLEMIERYQELLTLFPAADPDFLREQAERLTADTVANFVADTLETGNYPREEAYRARQRLRQLRDKYDHRFSARAFLKAFPQPAEHFGTRKVVASAELAAKQLAYLGLRYSESEPEDLAALLQRNGGCLSLACAEVEGGKSVMDWFNMFEDNEEMLQEVAFIEHRREIELSQRNLAQLKQSAVITAQHKKETLTCGCCYGDTFLIDEMAACLDGHLFCKECIARSADVMIGQGKFVVPCLEDCGKEFSAATLKSVLKRSVFLRMEQRRQFEEVTSADIADLETCPACDFSAIPGPDDVVFNCLNPDCMLSTCRKCREPNHIPLHCDELPEKEEHTRIRTRLEDRMTQALIRECWKCHAKFVKSDGCNKMQCTCGALMCYLCRQPVKDYSHFNGPGGGQFAKCELFSNNEKLHVDAVREEAVKARAEVAVENPNLDLKYDPTLLLP